MSENVAGSATLIDPTKSLTAHFVNLFESVLLVELILLANVHWCQLTPLHIYAAITITSETSYIAMTTPDVYV